jgi:hypothetical protein
MSDLPPELLEEIFQNVVSRSDQITITSLSYRSPGHVCARWRRIALNLPRLWLHLFVAQPANDWIGSLVWKWIKRAQSHALHLSLRAGATSDARPTPALAVLKVYLVSIAHCRSFEVQFHNLPFSSSRFMHSTPAAPWTSKLSPHQPETACLFPLQWNLRSTTRIGVDYLLLDQPCRSRVNLRESTLVSAQNPDPLLRVISYCQDLVRLTFYKSSIQYPMPQPLPYGPYPGSHTYRPQLWTLFDCNRPFVERT